MPEAKTETKVVDTKLSRNLHANLIIKLIQGAYWQVSSNWLIISSNTRRTYLYNRPLLMKLLAEITRNEGTSHPQ